MPDPVTGVLGGGAVIGAVTNDRAASKAAKAQSKASKEATALQKDQFERGLKEVAPFKQAGLSGLEGLTAAAAAPVGQFAYRDSAKFLNEYFSSPEFQALNAQATDQILRNRSVTGGLRSGGANVSLANIAPTLGINALDRINQQDLTAFGVNQGAQADRFNRLFSLSSMGANVASGNQVAGNNYASQAGANAINAGMARANAYGQQADAVNGLVSDAASIYMGGRMGLFNRGGKF